MAFPEAVAGERLKWVESVDSLAIPIASVTVQQVLGLR
jgi:hypothetical protein